jgi:hypothetical protein
MNKILYTILSYFNLKSVNLAKCLTDKNKKVMLTQLYAFILNPPKFEQINTILSQ